MSHTIALTEVKLSVEGAIKAALKLGVTYKENDQVRFYDGTIVEGLSVKLPGWTHPVVIDKDGIPHYDNYHGSWGNIKEWAKFSGLSLVAMSDHSLDNITIVETNMGMELIAEGLETSLV